MELSSALERKSEFRGKAYTNTIEPMLFYAFTPYHNQDNFPVFDTSSGLKFSATSLRPVFSVMIEWQIRIFHCSPNNKILDDEGFERIRFSVASTLLFDRQRVVLPGQPVREDDESDHFLKLESKPQRLIYLSSRNIQENLGFGRIKLLAFVFHLS